MKPQVPKILKKLYKKESEATKDLKIKTSDLPELGTLYREVETDVVWEVVGRAGKGRKTHSLPYTENDFENRLVILRSLDDDVLIYVPPYILDDNYTVFEFGSHVKVFEKIDSTEEVVVASANDEEEVKVMSISKTFAKLADPLIEALYVLNVNVTKHGLADILLEMNNLNASGEEDVQDKIRGRIKATWIPQNLLDYFPRESLLRSTQFRSLLEKGLIVAIKKGSARRIMDKEESQLELARLAEQYADKVLNSASA